MTFFFYSWLSIFKSQSLNWHDIIFSIIVYPGTVSPTIKTNSNNFKQKKVIEMKANKIFMPKTPFRMAPLYSKFREQDVNEI